MRISDWSSDVCSSDLLGIRGRGRSATATLMHNFDFAQLTSITNYTNNDYSMSLDADAGATPSTFIGGAAYDVIAVLKNESIQVSQELRFDGTYGPLSWVTGLFYYREDKRHLTDYIRTIVVEGKLCTYSLDSG